MKKLTFRHIVLLLALSGILMALKRDAETVEDKAKHFMNECNFLKKRCACAFEKDSTLTDSTIRIVQVKMKNY